MIVKKTDRSHSDDCYHEVMALFLALREVGGFSLHRAEMKGGECRAEPIDFMADVEIKAKRALSNDRYALGEWEMVLRDPSKYPMVSPVTREKLGRTFEAHDLDVSGAYRMLYFKVKNNK